MCSTVSFPPQIFFKAGGENIQGARRVLPFTVHKLYKSITRLVKILVQENHRNMYDTSILVRSPEFEKCLGIRLRNLHSTVGNKRKGLFNLKTQRICVAVKQMQKHGPQRLKLYTGRKILHNSVECTRQLVLREKRKKVKYVLIYVRHHHHYQKHHQHLHNYYHYQFHHHNLQYSTTAIITLTKNNR